MIWTDVSFAYGDKQVLDHFSLTLPEQGITALTGPSGCGKTTLLRLAAGLEQPDSGTLEGPEPGRIAFLFQENRLLPGLSAAAQIGAVLPRGADPMPWLKLVGLEADANTRPNSLSGGMQRRVSLARCMAYGQNKELLLLDEPFTGVDKARIGNLARALRALGVPIVYAAHGSESLTMADRVISLEGIPLRVTEDPHLPEPS